MFSLCFPWGRCAGADVLGPMCWGPCAGAHVLGPMCWGPCAGAHVLGPMCWGPCAGAHVLGPMCWGPCAGAHVLGPMCSWTSPARNICDEKSDEKVKFCRRLPKYRPHRELYAPSKVPPRCKPPSQKGQSCGGKKSEKKVKLRVEKRQTSTKTSGEISRLSEILRAVQSSPEMQPN